MSDIYCYPNTSILKNKLNITNAKNLLKTEIELTSTQLMDLQQHPIKGNFDFTHLCRIHKYIFEDLFPWAGKIRTVDIGKGNLFCLVPNIPSYANTIFSKYYKECKAHKKDPHAFVHVLTNHYADLNALHPFREGNGRAQREFARELCLNCGYTFDLTHTTHEEMLHASIQSFNGNNTELEQIFQTAIQPIMDPEQHQKRLEQAIAILSIDDIANPPTTDPHDQYDPK